MTRRWPLRPLLDATGLSETKLLRRLRWSGQTLKNARENGLTDVLADRVACRLGFVPWEVWPDWFEPAFRSCAECAASFVPSPHPQHRFCSRKCRNVASSREWKRRNPETNRANRRAYYAEHGDYERARQRRYEAAKKPEVAA
jgi:lambda repressor-like predicted transcriptional regulator